LCVSIVVDFLDEALAALRTQEILEIKESKQSVVKFNDEIQYSPNSRFFSIDVSIGGSKTVDRQRKALRELISLKPLL
jgi:hypothetical protein